jgi:hypothetical protein
MNKTNILSQKNVSEDEHSQYLKKQILKGIRYVRVNSENFIFRLYAPTGERVEEIQYTFYSYKEAYKIFKDYVTEKYFGLFDYSDER